jgi:hypothetical protein
MGLFDLLKKRKRLRELDNRFRPNPVSADDNLLLPHQIGDLPQLAEKAALEHCEIVFVWELSDEILPEDQHFVPHLLMEFRNDSQLAMIHATHG